MALKNKIDYRKEILQQISEHKMGIANEIIKDERPHF